MRWVVYTLAALVVLKFYMQTEFYREATSEALIQAYAERALTACRTNAAGPQPTPSRHLWDKPGGIHVAIGRDDLNVGIWQVDHENWKAAHRQTYLVLSPVEKHTGFTCTYDVQADAATVSRSG